MTKATRILWTSLGRMHRALFWVHQILLWKQWWGIHLGGVGSWKQQKPPTPQKVNPVCQLTYKNGYTLTYTEVLFWSVSFFLSKKQHLVFNASPTPFRSGVGRFIFDNWTPKHLKIYFFANGGPKFVRWHQPLDSIKILERFQSGQKVPYPWSSRRTESLKLQSFMFMNFLGDRHLTKKELSSQC